jgi:Tubulin-tyrosine ligase family
LYATPEATSYTEIQTSSLAYGLSYDEWDTLLEESYLLASINFSISDERSSRMTTTAANTNTKKPRPRSASYHRKNSSSSQSYCQSAGTYGSNNGSGSISISSGGGGGGDSLVSSSVIRDILTMKKHEKVSTKVLYLTLLLRDVLVLKKQLIIDGWRNIWIVKAPDVSRGLGMQLAYRLEDILECERGMSGRMVQKYVECPLLVSKRIPFEGKSVELRANLPYTSEAIEDKKPRRPKSAHILSSQASASRETPVQMPSILSTNKDPVTANPQLLFTKPQENTSFAANNTGSNTSTTKCEEETPLCRRQRHKFDIRVWVLVTSFEPCNLKAFVYTAVYGRCCAIPYNDSIEELSNHFIHLTNYSVQKKGVVPTSTLAASTNISENTIQSDRAVHETEAELLLSKYYLINQYNTL